LGITLIARFLTRQNPAIEAGHLPCVNGGLLSPDM
jgi:hypothetical protein